MTVDLAIIGAGPAGMRAAIAASSSGLSVLVVDEQEAPGGQIWRAVERRREGAVGAVLGPDYLAGHETVAAFRASGCTYSPRTRLWQIEPLGDGFRLFLAAGGGRSETRDARQVILATGALERAAPFPGWTLPGVMTVGAAQIQLKSSGQIPDRPVWIAGSGPLPLLYITQLLTAGGKVAGYIDTAPLRRLGKSWPYLVKGAVRPSGMAQLAKGIRWLWEIRAAGVPVISGGRIIRAEGHEALERLVIESPRAGRREVAASLLLVHEGVIPSTHVVASLGCEMVWDAAGGYVRPRTDEWGETTVPGLFLAGDGARIVGARAAGMQGARAALRVVGRLRPAGDPHRHGARLGRQLRRETALRPFLERFYAPDAPLSALPDATIICRCEEVTAGQIRAAAALGTDPNLAKALTRCGMGPCQGRQCGPVVARMLAEIGGVPPAGVGLYRARPPLKPITLGELASLGAPDEAGRA